MVSIMSFGGKRKHKRTVGLRKSDGSAGSITIMVTLILIPTMVVNGFFVDLARLKLWGNQAVMTADNYGEGVLTIYDNLLKELYGLFAVSQSEDGRKALDSLDEYIKSSFDPNSSTISWDHVALKNKSYSGFMPYSSADIELSWEAEKSANLGNRSVLTTQIGDFMRFRIVQAMSGSAESVLSAVDALKNTAANSKALEAKSDLDDEVEELLEAVEGFYNAATVAKQYPNFLDALNKARKSAYDQIETIGNSESLKLYREYTDNESAIKAAEKHQKNLKKGESLSQEEKDLLALKARYDADPDARKNVLEKKFVEAYTVYKEKTDVEPIDFGNFEKISSALYSLADNIEKKYKSVKEHLQKLEDTLANESVSEELKDGLNEDIETIKKVIPDSEEGAKPYYELADEFKGGGSKGLNFTFNNEAESTAQKTYEDMKNKSAAYIKGEAVSSVLVGAINSERYNNFMFDTDCAKLYNDLKSLFGTSGGDGEKYEKKKKAAKKATSNANKALSESEKSEARDIPKSFSMGDDGGSVFDNLTIKRLISTAADAFDAGSFVEGGNKAILNFYTVAYDFSMFSSRMTNVEPKSDDQNSNSSSSEEKTVATSLTGYELSKKINYLYKAELEYIFGGHKSSVGNLNEVRNKIIAFRVICNYSATYTISEVNKAIKAIGSAASAVNPLLGIAVVAALRIAVTAVESIADWNELKDGESVNVFKTKLEHMTAYDQIKDLIESKSSAGKKEASFQLNYQQYLIALIIFLTPGSDIASRTGDLIELNVNTVQQGIGETGKLSELKFKMSSAVTAVKTTCAVQLDFVVMPKDMAKIFLGDDYDSLEGYMKNQYVFHVSRSY